MAVAVSLALVIGLAGAFGFLVTTFLFHFSSGQDRMEPVVNYGALGVIAITALLTIVVWRIRSPAEAAKYAAIATGVFRSVRVVRFPRSASLGSLALAAACGPRRRLSGRPPHLL